MTTFSRVTRWFQFSLLTGIVVVLRATPLEFSELPLTNSDQAGYVDLTKAQDGNAYVSWVEPVDAETDALKMSRFNRETQAWGDPVTISQGKNWFLNWADKPVIATGLRGRIAAAWFVNNAEGGYHAVTSTSSDHGVTWTASRPLSNESDRTEFVSLAPLLNGSWLAVWLDARDHADSGNMQLRSRVLGSDEPDELVDDRVCDCCPISTLVLPNGAVLTAYRDRDETEIRDITYRNFSRGEWSVAKAPAQDGWQIKGCPVNGASLSRRSGHVASAWFTGANETPQVLTARSNNLGRSWNLIARMDDPAVESTGAVSSTVLRDGSQWVSWVEAGGTTALRGLNREGSLGEISRLPGTAEGRPEMVMLSNNSNEAAQLLIARQETSGVKTYIGRIAADTSATLDDCGCDAGESATRGHAVRGKIVKLLPDRKALLVAHEEIPGIMNAMTMSFQVDPRVIDLVKPDQTILGRMERRDDGQWWLFGIRVLDDSTP